MIKSNTIKTNSELPLCMLQKYNYDLNSIDFVLFHLYISNSEYRKYYKAMRIVHPERVMIFDNSGYEFYIQGKNLDITQFIAAIVDLNPTYYILPDTLMDKDKTLNNAKQFLPLIEAYKDQINSEPLAVLQGNSADELFECLYEYKKMGLKNVCVPFHNTFFKENGYKLQTATQQDIVNFFKEVYQINTITDDIAYAIGRVEFIQHAKDALLGNFNYIHMLGSHCPFEKAFYGEFNSMDTGYPVKLGYELISLGQEKSKPNTIIDDFFQEKLNSAQMEMIQMNVNTFAKLRSDLYITE